MATTEEERSALPLTPTALHILLTLTDGPLHGYAIKRVVEERTDGIVKLGAGTLYHAISSLVKRGHLTETKPPDPVAAGSSRWRFYAITDSGLEILRAEVRRLEGDVAAARAKLAGTGLAHGGGRS